MLLLALRESSFYMICPSVLLFLGVFWGFFSVIAFIQSNKHIFSGRTLVFPPLQIQFQYFYTTFYNLCTITTITTPAHSFMTMLFRLVSFVVYQIMWFNIVQPIFLCIYIYTLLVTCPVSLFGCFSYFSLHI